MKKISLLFLISLFFGCKYDKLEDTIGPPLYAESGYPTEIDNILTTKCATSGCHNSASRDVAGGLDFSTWDQMFDGGRNGTAIIPFSPENSYLLYSVNTDSTQGPILLPTMPYLEQPISASEYSTLLSWIANGAPNKDGFVKFSDDPNRKKIYVCMQGCDKVAVFDEKTKVIMRYISVGSNPNQIEAPHLVRVSPDNQYWYVVFYSGDVIQKFRTSDDSLVGQTFITSGDWNTVIISPDGSKGFVNGTTVGKTVVVDLNTMTNLGTLSRDFPHGGFITPDGRYMYQTCQNGNFITKTDLTTAPFYDYDQIRMYPDSAPSTSSSINPHEMILSPDGSKYFVSGQSRNEVRVFQTSNDSLLQVIHVGEKPQEFTVMNSLNKVYVTCTEAYVSPTKKGMVYSIDCNTYALDSIYTGFQPHGIVADESTNLVYVANLNADLNGPAPHHFSTCGGRNGNITIINANTFTLYNKELSNGTSFQYKCEVLSAPYFISIRN
jgi:DNA-binding beta-propeller fold protein YncE